MGRPAYDVTPQEAIIRGLEWLTRFRIYAEDTSGKPSKAEVYDKAWMQLVRRVKDYTEDNDKLIRFYEWLRDTKVMIDSIIKDTLMRYLKDDGKNRKLLMFLSDDEIPRA